MLISTILTLFIIPALLAILDDIKKTRKKIRQKEGVAIDGFIS